MDLPAGLDIEGTHDGPRSRLTADDPWHTILSQHVTRR